MVDFEVYKDIMGECEGLAKFKNLQYGDESLKLFNGDALFIRIVDKCERLKKLYEEHKNTGFYGKEADNIEDTLKDLINYSIYLLMMTRGRLK